MSNCFASSYYTYFFCYVNLFSRWFYITSLFAIGVFKFQYYDDADTLCMYVCTYEDSVLNLRWSSLEKPAGVFPAAHKATWSSASSFSVQSLTVGRKFLLPAMKRRGTLAATYANANASAVVTKSDGECKDDSISFVSFGKTVLCGRERVHFFLVVRPSIVELILRNSFANMNDVQFQDIISAFGLVLYSHFKL